MHNKTMQLSPGSDCFAGQQTPCVTGAREYSGVLRSTDSGETWEARGPHIPVQ